MSMKIMYIQIYTYISLYIYIYISVSVPVVDWNVEFNLTLLKNISLKTYHPSSISGSCGSVAYILQSHLGYSLVQKKLISKPFKKSSRVFFRSQVGFQVGWSLTPLWYRRPWSAFHTLHPAMSALETEWFLFRWLAYRPPKIQQKK